MNDMFVGTNFNVNISKWDVSSVVTMDRMFMHATSFKQQLCGDAWVYSQASKIDMFLGSSGSISRSVCGQSPPQRWLERWQMSTTPIADDAFEMRKCPICGTFKKSGRKSCCAPGGAWHGNCGGVVSRNIGHSWLEGMEACTRKCMAGLKGADACLFYCR